MFRPEKTRGQKMMLASKQNGYTLIEVAIVLVVLALILGGVFVGGSAVLENARTATLLGQIKDLAAASRDFKSRYGYFPGDLPNAAALVTTDGGVSAGCSYSGLTSATVGNGLVDTATESRCALEHLIKARMLNKVELSAGNYAISHPFGGGDVSLWSTSTKENAVRVTNLPCKIALRIDDKLDNASGTPLTSGFVTSESGGASTCTLGVDNGPMVVILIRY